MIRQQCKMCCVCLCVFAGAGSTESGGGFLPHKQPCQCRALALARSLRREFHTSPIFHPTITLIHPYITPSPSPSPSHHLPSHLIPPTLTLTPPTLTPTPPTLLFPHQQGLDTLQRDFMNMIKRSSKPVAIAILHDIAVCEDIEGEEATVAL